MFKQEVFIMPIQQKNRPPELKTTYQQDFQVPVQARVRQNSTHGTLAREGIIPVSKSPFFERGIAGTRFLSQLDVKLAALAPSLGVKLFPGKPYTPKEERMVRIAGFFMGIFVQRGGFLGKKKCVIDKKEPFEQHAFQDKDVIDLLTCKKFDYASIWCGAGTICGSNTLRLDVQGSTSENEEAVFQNLQIQVQKARQNKPGKTESTTVATVLVSHDIDQQIKNVAQEKHILKKTKHAFFLSAKTGHKYEVNLRDPADEKILQIRLTKMPIKI